MRVKQLQEDFLYCENIIKQHSNSFYYAFSGLPDEKANAVYAIYAFCRIADDCVDENIALIDKIQSLEKLHEELDLFNEYQEIDHPLWRALRHVFDTYDMDIQPFYDQLTGQAMDIKFASPRTMEDLESYSYYVAGSVGLMLLPIIASTSKNELKGAAIDLGVAMQITNILRDVGEDYCDKRRIYLPELERIRFRYTVNDLNVLRINRAFIGLWETLAIRAEELYDRFHKQVHKFDVDSQMPVALSAQVYRGILDEVRNNDYDCLSKRNYVAKKQMMEMTNKISNCS